MALSIGQQLRAAREERGLSIQDLAHETRIHANYIHCLEEDDYSKFASITYAKSFLQLYSRHLDVDASEALEVFQGSNRVNLHGTSLVSDLSDKIEPMPGEPRYRKPRHRHGEKPGGAPIFLGVILAILLLAIPTFYFLGYNADNPEDVATEIVKNSEELKENLTSAEKPVEPVEKIETPKIQPRPFPSQEELDSKFRKPKPEPTVAKTEETPPAPKPNNDVTATPAKPVQATPIKAVPIAAVDPEEEITEADTPPEETEITDVDVPEEKPVVDLPAVERPEMKPAETTLASNTPSSVPLDIPEVEDLPNPLPKVEKPKAEKLEMEKPEADEPKPEADKPKATKPPLRAIPIVAKPIRSTEEPDAIPNEDITPPDPQKDRKSIMNLIPDEPRRGDERNRFPRRNDN